MLANPHLQLHLSVLLWGFTAILGKLITLHAIPLVFWRVVIVSLCLLLWWPMWRQLARLTRRDLGLASANGVLITLHWLCFYGSIKTSNASVAATCMTFGPVFLSLIEPVTMRQAFKSRDLLVAVSAIPGVALVVGGIPADMHAGLALGTLAAFLAAAFSLVNKNLALRAPALALTTVEMSTGVLLLGALIPLWPALGADFVVPDLTDFTWLVILALACTLIPFALTLVALRKLSAFSVQLAVNLEPVYAILLATALLGEGAELRWQFYLGVALILAAVLGHTFILKTAPATAKA